MSCRLMSQYLFGWMHSSRIFLHYTVNQNRFIQFSTYKSIGVRSDYNSSIIESGKESLHIAATEGVPPLVIGT